MRKLGVAEKHWKVAHREQRLVRRKVRVTGKEYRYIQNQH